SDLSTHSLTLGGLVAFITLALQLVWPVEALGYIIASGQEAATAAQRVLEIFDTVPEITDKDQNSAERDVVLAPASEAAHRGVPHQRAAHRGDPGPRWPDDVRTARRGPGQARAEPPSRSRPRSRGHLVFDHVAFSYPGAAEPVLKDVELDLAPGQTVVLTGAT